MSTIFDLPHVRKHKAFREKRNNKRQGGGGGWGMVCCCSGPFHVSGIARLSPLIC